MEEARETARQKALAAIRAAGEKDWRAHAEWLKLCFPEYRKPDTRVEVNTQAQAGVQVVCTEEQRQALIAARERFLSEPELQPEKPKQPQLQAGTPIGATQVPEDPKIALMKSIEGGISDEQVICGADRLGRFGNTD
jgi:hypothetical protein